MEGKKHLMAITSCLNIEFLKRTHKHSLYQLVNGKQENNLVTFRNNLDEIPRTVPHSLTITPNNISHSIPQLSATSESRNNDESNLHSRPSAVPLATQNTGPPIGVITPNTRGTLILFSS